MTLERYCLGLPAIVIAIAENQINVAKQGDLLGIDYYLGESEKVTEQLISSAFQLWMENYESIERSSSRALQLVDGLGTERVVEVLEGI